MRIAFLGTPLFAARSLERLYEDGFDIACVFTQPDKPRSRGMKVSSCPVKDLAASHGTPVYQPVSLKDGAAVEALKRHDCELIAVVAYGRILPREILDFPAYGAINVHGSLLPKYRGAAPIQWAIINGEKETGVTSQFVSYELDAGDMIYTRKTLIGDDETAGELFNRLSLLSAELLSTTITAVARGEAVRIPQNPDDVTFAPPLTKEMSSINWADTAEKIKCKVRGQNPWPAATALLGGKMFKVLRVAIGEQLVATGEQRVTIGNRLEAGGIQQQAAKSPGEIVSAGKHGIEVACSDGTIIITELQIPGGKIMSAAEYLRGHTL